MKGIIVGIVFFIVFVNIAFGITETKITASDGALHDCFGWSVFTSGDFVIVGAPGSHEFYQPGKAYLYRYVGSGWDEIKITPSDGFDGDYFGYSVSISDETVIIGAPRICLGIIQGQAYVYRFIGSGWDETIITASDGEGDDHFGESVSISGEYAIVGAPWDDDKGRNSGSAYIYHYNGNTWDETKITASDGEANDYFGVSVSISGNNAIVGSIYDDDYGENSGAAYIYHFNGNTWDETKITASDGEAGDNFGFSVSILGDNAIVGLYDDDYGENSGAAYIYHFNGASWDETKITASDGEAGDGFGSSVSISGKYVIVGAMFDNILEYNDVGSAYLYYYNGVDWNETKITSEVPDHGGDWFGISVSISNDLFVVGEPGEGNPPLIDVGSAFVYGDFKPEPTGSISGRVIDSETGEGIPSAQVIFYSQDKSENKEKVIGAREVGDFYIELAPGTYTVIARKDGYSDARRSWVHVQEGETIEISPLEIHEISDAEIDTMILTNYPRMIEVGYNSSDVDTLRNWVGNLHSTPRYRTNMTATHRDLGESPDVPAAIGTYYNAWATDPANLGILENLSGLIDDYIHYLCNLYPSLRTFIIVGSTEIIPGTPQYDMWESFPSFADYGTWGQIYDTGYFLSDIYYSSLDDNLFTTELEIGRLVETPAQITELIMNYIARDATLTISRGNSFATCNVLEQGPYFRDQMLNRGLDTTGSIIGCSELTNQGIKTSFSNQSITIFGAHGSPTSFQATAEEDPDPGNECLGIEYFSVTDAQELSFISGSLVFSDSCLNGCSIWNNGGGSTLDFPEVYAAKEVAGYWANVGLGDAKLTSICVAGEDAWEPTFTQDIMDITLKYCFGGWNVGYSFLLARNQFWRHQCAEYPGDAWRCFEALKSHQFYGIPRWKLNTSSFKTPVTKCDYKIRVQTDKSGDNKLNQILTFDVESYQIQEDGNISINGTLRHLVGENYPELPVFEKIQLAPVGSTIESIALETEQSVFEEIQNEISAPIIGNSFQKYEGVFSYSGFYPEQPFLTTSETINGGNTQLLSVVAFPVQYNHETQTTRIWSKLVFDVTYNIESANDTDGDGLPNYWECYYKLDEFNASGDDGADGNPDNDGLDNTAELTHGTDPRNPDTDNDGYSDGEEVEWGTDPCNSDSFPVKGALTACVAFERSGTSPPDPSWIVPLEVTLCRDGDAVLTRNAFTDDSGSFTVDVLAGTYDLLVKNSHTLANRQDDITIPENGATALIDFGTLFEGDADNDNAVISSDFFILRNTYNMSEGDPGYDDRADFDEDQAVISSDFFLLRNHYNEQGAACDR